MILLLNIIKNFMLRVKKLRNTITWALTLIITCNTSRGRFKEILCVTKYDFAQLATLLEYSIELSGHLAVWRPDVALPSVQTTH